MNALTLAQRRDWLGVRVDELRGWLHRAWVDLEQWSFDGAPLALGSAWPERSGVRRLAHPRVEPPAAWPAHERRLLLDLGGEGLVRLRYQGGAEEAFGLDSEHKAFAVRGEPFEIGVEIVARLPFGMPNRDPRLALARVVHVDVQLERLVRRLELVCEAAEELDGHEAAPALVEAAARALRRLEWPSATRDYVARQAETPLLRNVWELPDGLDPMPPDLDEAARASVAAAAEVLDGELAAVAERHPPAGALLLTGHAHLDLAWRWPLAETRRKARRTLWTQVGLLERHPEFHFNQSTAQVYAFLEEDDPELLERLAALAAERRLEPIGGMWVEPDCNMPAGESLVRQLLYGQRWFHRRFGGYHAVCWMPDCFGFTPALPQLLLGAGIRHFLTVKIAWSETNRFPYDLFWWEGLDGSRVLAHMFENPRGRLQRPRHAARGARHVVATTAAATPIRRACCRSATATAAVARPTRWWSGRGRWTASRRCRRSASGAWTSSSSAPRRVWATARCRPGRASCTWSCTGRRSRRRGARSGCTGAPSATSSRPRRSPRCARCAAATEPASLEELWRVLLRNEFHDILPGSSVREVYEDAERELADVVAGAGDAIDARLGELEARLGGGDGDGVLVANPDLSPRPVRVELDDGSVLTSARIVAGLEVAVVTPGEPEVPATADGRVLENALVRVELAEDGALASVYDKRAGREVLAGRGNQLWAYVDKPRSWDAWDLEASYADDGAELPPADAIRVVEHGPHRAAVRVERTFRHSRVVQDVRLWANSARVELFTRLDWHDRRWLLKARFPLAVRAQRATFETAFGCVERPTHRNTSWDAARFEVPGHRFADLSEPGYGAALLNDGRYGHHALGNELGLSLLRSPVWPDPLADEGEQELLYALYPHAGGWLEGGVLAEAEDLNRPLLARRTRAAAGASLRPLRLDGVPAGLGALKVLEDGGGLLLRVYEPQGARGSLALELPPGWEPDAALDLLERPVGAPQLELEPFAVRTWRLRRAGGA